jgi:hypothetical protein
MKISDKAKRVVPLDCLQTNIPKQSVNAILGERGEYK